MKGFTRTLGPLVLGYYVVMIAWWIKQEGLAQRRGVQRAGGLAPQPGDTGSGAP